MDGHGIKSSFHTDCLELAGFRIFGDFLVHWNGRSVLDSDMAVLALAQKPLDCIALMKLVGEDYNLNGVRSRLGEDFAIHADLAIGMGFISMAIS